MSKMQRNKGASGEREIAAILHDLTGWDVRRRVRQHDGDSDLEGVPGWCVEVKRHARATRGTIAQWWQQAVDQCDDAELPVLFLRQDRDEWRAVWPFAALLTEQRAHYWRDIDWTAETTVEAWAAVAREIVGQSRALPNPSPMLAPEGVGTRTRRPAPEKGEIHHMPTTRCDRQRSSTQYCVGRARRSSRATAAA